MFSDSQLLSIFGEAIVTLSKRRLSTSGREAMHRDAPTDFAQAHMVIEPCLDLSVHYSALHPRRLMIGGPDWCLPVVPLPSSSRPVTCLFGALPLATADGACGPLQVPEAGCEASSVVSPAGVVCPASGGPPGCSTVHVEPQSGSTRQPLDHPRQSHAQTIRLYL